jgi:hypothetical protein
VTKVVHLSDRRDVPVPAPQTDIERLTVALGDAWALARSLERRNDRLEVENAQFVADRDKWAMEWMALQQLFTDVAASEDRALSWRYCCFCGTPYLGNATACPSHIYLLLLENRSERASRESDTLVDDLLEPARGWAR